MWKTNLFNKVKHLHKQKCDGSQDDVKAIKKDTENEEEKKSAWELYELCKNYLEDNEKHWQQKKVLRMKEMKKIEKRNNKR